ncbi:hypothetical protein HanRHA438_Chr02g0089071 [Helianthus annuus]|nr:hypothetical protein HanRHA438_Chr02g0089071 [Helianthus annuus]
MVTDLRRCRSTQLRWVIGDFTISLISFHLPQSRFILFCYTYTLTDPII